MESVSLLHKNHIQRLTYIYLMYASQKNVFTINVFTINGSTLYPHKMNHGFIHMSFPYTLPILYREGSLPLLHE